MASLASCISLLRRLLCFPVYKKALRRVGALEGCVSPADSLFHCTPWCNGGLQGPGEYWLLKGRLSDSSGQRGKEVASPSGRRPCSCRDGPGPFVAYGGAHRWLPPWLGCRTGCNPWHLKQQLRIHVLLTTVVNETMGKEAGQLRGQ